jgi:hypothetical protein
LSGDFVIIVSVTDLATGNQITVAVTDPINTAPVSDESATTTPLLPQSPHQRLLQNSVGVQISTAFLLQSGDDAADVQAAVTSLGGSANGSGNSTSTPNATATANPTATFVTVPGSALSQFYQSLSIQV